MLNVGSNPTSESFVSSLFHIAFALRCVTFWHVMNINSVESSRIREDLDFKGKLQGTVALAFLGGVVLLASFVLLHGGGDHETFQEVNSVRHSAMPGIPRDVDGGGAGRTMVATYYG